MKNKNTPLLEVKDLSIAFKKEKESVRVVDNISFSLHEGETLALVGESGSGKSVTAQTILRLCECYSQGKILFEGDNLLDFSEKQMLNIRGKKIGMIFQDPITSLNPTLKIGEQITEGLNLSKKEKKLRLIEILHSVGISEPQLRMRQYPHELSGGMRQRVMIAIAMISSPKLLIADEPTTALDVTIQAQILELMKSIQKKMKMAILLITHDLRIVAGMADRVLVMYRGQIVETGSVESIFYSPSHPYTEALLHSLPNLDMDKSKELFSISGFPPHATEKREGCLFAPRCSKLHSPCLTKVPKLLPIDQNQDSACLLKHSDNQYE